MLNVGQAPVGGPNGVRFISLIFMSLALIVACRNIYIAGFVLFCLNVTFRLKNQISHWTDQIFVQNYGLSSILSGVNIYSSNNLGEHSFSYYLPMGSLFGSLPIYFGLYNYWDFYHILIPLLLFIPFIHSSSILNLSIFVVIAFFFPLVDYTTGGGNVELSYAFLIPGLYLLSNGRNTFCALVILSFGIMLRQPSVFLIPFVFFALIREKEIKYVWGFFLLLFLAGGWYIFQDVGGFFRSNFFDSTPFQEIWYKRNGGLTTNFSISTLLQFLGFNNAWDFDNKLYILGTLIVNIFITLLASIAYFRKSIDIKGYLALGVLTVLFVYVLSRGFAFLHYLMSCCFLFLALYNTSDKHTIFSLLSDNKSVPIGIGGFVNIYTKIIAGVVLVLILFPLLMVTTHRLQKIAINTLPASFYLEDVGSSSKSAINFSSDRTGITFPIGSSLVVELEKAVYVESLCLFGERFVSTNIEGIEVFNYPINQAVGFIRNGIILGSNDGIKFFKIRDFDNIINYHIYPVCLSVAKTVKYIKIEIGSAYDDSKIAVIGNVIVNSP